jgi:hypothetical protein
MNHSGSAAISMGGGSGSGMDGAPPGLAVCSSQAATSL